MSETQNYLDSLLDSESKKMDNSPSEETETKEEKRVKESKPKKKKTTPVEKKEKHVTRISDNMSKFMEKFEGGEFDPSLFQKILNEEVLKVMAVVGNAKSKDIKISPTDNNLESLQKLHEELKSVTSLSKQAITKGVKVDSHELDEENNTSSIKYSYKGKTMIMTNDLSAVTSFVVLDEAGKSLTPKPLEFNSKLLDDYATKIRLVKSNITRMTTRVDISNYEK